MPKLIYERLKNTPGSLLYLFLIGVCLLIPGFAFPAYLSLFINTYFATNTLPWKWEFLGAVLLAVVFFGVLTQAQLHFLTRLNTKLSMRFSSNFFWHILKLPINFYTQRDAGEISFRMHLNSTVAENLTGPVISAVINLMLILFFGTAMFFFDVAIASISIFIGVVNLVAMYFIVRSRVVAYASLQQNIGKSISQSIGGMRNIEIIKSKGVEPDFFSRWAGYYTKNVNATQQIQKKDVILATLPTFFQSLAFTVLLGIGSMRIIEGMLSIGALMALQILQINFLLPINRFIGLSSVMQNMKKDIERLNDVMKNEVDPIYNRRHLSTTKPQSRLKGSLEFRNVSFRFAPLSPLVIENISFSIKAGEKIALIGSSGCGKTTIAKLAMGLFYPTSGEILYDGMPLSAISVEHFRNSVSSVSQDIFLFSGTIRENLTFWNDKVPDETLIKAARDAAIHEDIAKRDGAYDALLVEEGKNLSGGQRQRLEIARAFLYNPSLIILDEATSALDNKTEAYIADKIRERGCSSLIIANRLSSIRDCNEIIIIDKGCIIQRGVHDELIDHPGIYQELVRAEAYEE